jgi:hypothetical protein
MATYSLMLSLSLVVGVCVLVVDVCFDVVDPGMLQWWGVAMWYWDVVSVKMLFFLAGIYRS